MNSSLARTDAWSPGRRRTLATPVATVLLGLAVVLLARWGPDWPAQEFRAWQAAHDGLTAWTSRWYSGEALAGYSVLYPILGAVFGAGAIGIAATAVASWAAASLAPPDKVRARCYALAVAVCLTQSLLIGQVPYLLGVAFGLVAVRSLVIMGSDAEPGVRPGARSAVLTGLCAAACSLSSPLSGASLLLATPALALVYGWRRVGPMAGAAIGIAVSSVLGGASGPFPFEWLSLMGVLIFCALTLVLSGPDQRALRVFALCYLCAAVALFLFKNPIGGNAARVGKLIALPLAVRFATLPRGLLRRAAVGLAIIGAVVWPSVAFASSIMRGAGDPSQRSEYFNGLLRFLRTQDTTGGRLEVPMMREHWEALWIARAFPIARGWERQSDLLYNAVLYHPISASRYHQWLTSNAVSLVALPDAPIDYGGRAEAQLLRRPPAYLRPIWHDRHWQVWRVADAQPLVAGPATLTALSASSVSVDFTRPGTAVVRIHASPLWHVTEGHGCVDATDTGWLRVRANRPGPLTLEAEVNAGLLAGQNTCRR
jgi:hypothetical protein